MPSQVATLEERTAVARNLDRAINERGILLREAAAAIGIGEGQLSRWRTGRTFPSKPENQQALADYFFDGKLERLFES